ncbi:RluA family pseudouridine synthase [Enterobacteriaceae endosymbiont of Donacia tomentosa]|uniref:RluA family pseudouridine synthase n=1 Tax=Enterobacteriaceae endosymbiont of Donacia tomentosa TaxID=2675787 RepID=UPI0031B56B15
MLNKKIKWEAQNILLKTIYEDKYILVINKDVNLVVHPDINTNKNKKNTVFNGLLYYFPYLRDLPRAGIIHRLDKNTTGLMIIAKTMFVYFSLKRELKKHNIIREYEAIVHGTISQNNIINQPIKRLYKKNNIRMIISNDGKKAVTKYFVKNIFEKHTHLRIRLETGRTHQIRVHLLHINHNIIGDPIYKKNMNNNNFYNKIFKQIIQRQALHACYLKFIHPIYNIPIKLYSPLPNDIYKLLDFLEQNKILNKKY